MGILPDNQGGFGMESPPIVSGVAAVVEDITTTAPVICPLMVVPACFNPASAVCSVENYRLYRRTRHFLGTHKIKSGG